MSDSSTSTGLEIALSTSSLPPMATEVHENAPEPPTPSEISFEVEIEEDQDMPQQPLNPRACPFRPVSPFLALSILGVRSTRVRTASG